MDDRADILDPLDGRSSALFLLAGGLLVVFAANTGARTFAEMGTPLVHDVFGPAGFFVGMLGLVGLYPGLADRSPRLARVAFVLAAIPAVGWFVIATYGIGDVAGVLPDASVALPGGVFVVVFLSTVLTYLLFGVTSLRTDIHSTAVGILLLAPVVVFLSLIAGMGVMARIEWAEFALDSGHAVAHLAIGIALRTVGVPADRAGPAADSTS